ncbi:hypothetical protein VTP01DRAFT_2722 [Rhizomucor pusillus]|uniref:uncharacterized protein n=1 Tax=Rhizomucor pusillus TaxID=4840 RepID=UPI003743D30E
MLSKTVIAVAACILAITSSTALADRCYCYDISGSPLYKDTQQECCTRAGGVCSMRTSIAWTLHPKARNPSKLAVTKIMPVCDASNRNPASSSYIAEQTMQTGAIPCKIRALTSNPSTTLNVGWVFFRIWVTAKVNDAISGMISRNVTRHVRKSFVCAQRKSHSVHAAVKNSHRLWSLK